MGLGISDEVVEAEIFSIKIVNLRIRIVSG